MPKMTKKDYCADQDLDTHGILKALNHYATNCTKRDSKRFLQEWMTSQGKSTFLIKGLKDEMFVESDGYVARILQLQNSVPEVSKENFLKQVQSIESQVLMKIAEGTIPHQEVKEVNAIMAEPVIEYDEFRARYGDIEFQIDEAIMSNFKDLEFEMPKWLEGYKVKPKELNYMISELTKIRAEIQESLDGTDKELKEGYGYLTKPQKKRYIKMLDEWLEQCKEYTNNKRKPRAKKIKTPIQLVKNLKYQDTFTDLSLSSIPPEEIVGSKELWVYNTKHRMLGYFYSVNGLSVKGSTIVNYDRAGSKRLKKPENVLDTIVRNYNFDDRMSWFDAIKTKDYLPTGRINNSTIIYKVYGTV